MALSKLNKALFRAKYGDQLYDAMVLAENVIVTDEGVEKSLADVILTLALKNEIPTNLNQLTNGPGYQTQSQVEALIGTAIGAVYKPAGSIAFANLPALTSANLGKVYNITDAFTTTEDFIEGAGKQYKAGADVGIIGIEDGGETVYKYNVFANFVDLAGYIEKVSGATAGNLPKLKTDGSIEDSNISADNVLVKPATAANGNLAMFDTNKQPVDSDVSDAAVSGHLSDTVGHITAAERTAWNAKARIYASPTQPENLQNGDLWLQTFEEEP